MNTMVKENFKWFRRKSTEKGSYEINHQYVQKGKPTSAIPQAVENTKTAQLEHNTEERQVYAFNAEDLPHLNNWVQYRLFDKYLTTLIAAIIEQVNLEEDIKKAFSFNAQRTTASLQELDEWVYLGAQMVEEMDELPFGEQLEMLTHESHEKLKKMKRHIVETRMIETLILKKDDFDKMYKQVIEKAIIVMDLLEAYELSLNELKIDKTAVQIDEVLIAMQIAYLEIETGDRLELEKCKTIDIYATDDIRKEFLIKEIVQKGITLKGDLHRKASVIVYRWEEELDD